MRVLEQKRGQVAPCKDEKDVEHFQYGIRDSRHVVASPIYGGWVQSVRMLMGLGVVRLKNMRP